jgi:hypothetical protein
MIPNISKKILLYPLFGILIFSIIKVLPNNSLSNFDTILISVITVVLCVCLEKTMASNFCPIPKITPTKCTMPNNENLTINPTNLTNPTNPTNLTNLTNPTDKTNEQFELLQKLKKFARKNKTIEHQTQINNPNTKSSTKSSTNPSTKSSTNPSTNISTKSSTSSASPNTKLITNPTTSLPASTSNKSSTKDKIPSTTNTKLNSIKSNSDKITFPFTYEFLKKTMDDMRLIASGDDKKKREIEQTQIRLQMNARSNVFFEILIQFMQKDLDLVYRYINPKSFNYLNEMIMGLKVRRSELTNKQMTLTDMDKLSKTQSREISATMSKYMKSMSGSAKYIDDNGFIQNMINNDMKYSIYTPKQHEKLGAYDSTFNNKWENDYALLNTDKWRPPIGHHMYKCKVEKECPVCPSLTKGYPVKVKDFDLARKILPPDVINEDYIREKLLTGLA